MTRVVTFSRSYTIVPTYECFNRCTYCNFRRNVTPLPVGVSPNDHPQWLSLEDAAQSLAKVKARPGPKVVELLVMAGEVPPKSRLRSAWHKRVVDICRLGLQHGFLPHTNVGPLSRVEMLELVEVNASMGLMIESTSQGLAVHARAPSKDPALRLAQLELAGELRIPFTTGLLLGIGETADDRLETLQAIADCHARHGHIQEVILQPHSQGSRQRFAGDSAWTFDKLPPLIQQARIILQPDIAIQVPPNLLLAYSPNNGDCLSSQSEAGLALLHACLDAGASDLGGISPLDEVNPDFAFPAIDGTQRSQFSLQAVLLSWGFRPVERLPVHQTLHGWMRQEPASIASQLAQSQF